MGWDRQHSRNAMEVLQQSCAVVPALRNIDAVARNWRLGLGEMPQTFEVHNVPQEIAVGLRGLRDESGENRDHGRRYPGKSGTIRNLHLFAPAAIASDNLEMGRHADERRVSFETRATARGDRLSRV